MNPDERYENICCDEALRALQGAVGVKAEEILSRLDAMIELLRGAAVGSAHSGWEATSDELIHTVATMDDLLQQFRAAAWKHVEETKSGEVGNG